MEPNLLCDPHFRSRNGIYDKVAASCSIRELTEKKNGGKGVSKEGRYRGKYNLVERLGWMNQSLVLRVLLSQTKTMPEDVSPWAKVLVWTTKLEWNVIVHILTYFFVFDAKYCQKVIADSSCVFWRSVLDRTPQNCDWDKKTHIGVLSYGSLFLCCTEHTKDITTWVPMLCWDTPYYAGGLPSQYNCIYP